MRTTGVLLASAVLALCCPAGLPAEEIGGRLYDRTGAVIAGARVMLMNDDYVKLAETKSGEQGEFSFPGLKPGLYFVQAKKPRFRLTQQHVNIEAGRDARIYLVAEVARAEDIITISGERIPGAEPHPPVVREFRSGGRMDGLKLLKGRPPGFPESARRRGVSGPVALLFAIRTDGTTADIVVLDSCDAELEKISVNAISGWQYAPMKLDGVPVEAHEIVQFEFTYQ